MINLILCNLGGSRRSNKLGLSVYVFSRTALFSEPLESVGEPDKVVDPKSFDDRGKDNDKKNNEYKQRSKVTHLPRLAYKFSSSPIFADSMAWTNYSYNFHVGNIQNMFIIPKALDFGIGVDLLRLEYQSQCFSNEMRNIRIDYKRVLGPDGKGENSWDYKFKQLYVYSYSKALFTGINTPNFSGFPEESFCFLGHAVLLELLRIPNITVNGEFNTQFNISVKVSDDEAKNIIKLLTDKYPWIEDCLQSDNSGMNFKFMSRGKIEAVFSNLYYMLTKSDSDRMLNIVNLSNSASYSTYCDPTSIPLGNSCFSRDFESFLFINSPKHDINSTNFYWGRAVFVYNKTDNVEVGTGNKLWFEVPCSRLDDWHVRGDVQCITGLKPSTNPKFVSKTDLNKFPICPSPGKGGSGNSTP